MEALKIRRLPVINKSKRMIGILSLGDVSHSAGDLLSECVKSALFEGARRAALLRRATPPLGTRPPGEGETRSREQVLRRPSCGWF
jgi:hypothetical protein